MHFNGQHIKGTFMNAYLLGVMNRLFLTEIFPRYKLARANDIDSINRFNNNFSHVRIQKIQSGVYGWVGVLTTFFTNVFHIVDLPSGPIASRRVSVPE